MVSSTVTDSRATAERADQRINTSERNLRIITAIAAVVIAFALIIGTTFSAVGAENAQQAARTAAAQTASNHKTGLENNQILIQIERAGSNHEQTLVDLRAVERDIDKRLQQLADQSPGSRIILRGVPFPTPPPTPTSTSLP
jgi:type VI protein secretion system component VasK